MFGDLQGTDYSGDCWKCPWLQGCIRVWCSYETAEWVSALLCCSLLSWFSVETELHKVTDIVYVLLWFFAYSWKKYTIIVKSQAEDKFLWTEKCWSGTLNMNLKMLYHSIKVSWTRHPQKKKSFAGSVLNWLISILFFQSAIVAHRLSLTDRESLQLSRDSILLHPY